MIPDRIRPLTPADIPACLVLARANGWLTDEAGWRGLFAVGEILGLESAHGRLVGSVVVNRFEPALWMIAMMLVDPAVHRQGLGRALLEHALRESEGIHVALYSSAAGRRLYEKLGFVEVGRSLRLTFEGEAPPPPTVEGLRPMRREDLPAVIALDEVAQGARRKVLLERLFEESERALVVAPGGEIRGFGLSRVVTGSRSIGPIVGRADGDALAIAGGLAAGARGGVRVDLQPGEGVLLEWATGGARGKGGDGGEAHAETSPLMSRGGRGLPGERGMVRAMVSRAYG